MKKFIPLLTICFVFSSFLAIQVAFDLFSTNANQNTKEQTYNKLIESTINGSTFETVEGQKLKFSKIDKKYVLVNFWASWCAPCMKELPALHSLMDDYPDLEIIGINADIEETLKGVKDIIKKNKVKFVNIFDEKSEYMAKYKVNHLPHTFLLREGKVVYNHEGFTDFSSKEFRKLLR